MSPLRFGDSGGELGGVATAGSEPVSPLGGWAVRATLGCWPEPKSTVRGTPNRARGASLDRSLPHPDLPGSLGLQGRQVLFQPLDCEGDKSSSNPDRGGGRWAPLLKVPPSGTGVPSEPWWGHSLFRTSGWGPTPGWGGHRGGSVLTTRPASPASGHLRLAVLPEDRLQMKWRESEGSSLGYLVQVKPKAGRDPPSPLCGPTANTTRRSLCWLPSALPSLLAVSPLAQGGCGGRTGPYVPTVCPHTWHV